MSPTKKHVCKICNSTKNHKQFVVKEMMFGFRDEFHYFECSDCGCLQIEEVPSNLSKYYPENYYSFGKYNGKKFKGITGKLNKLRYEHLWTGPKVLRTILKQISGKKFFIFDDLSINKDLKILDVGCGGGKKFLYPLAEAGFKNIKGCDPFLEKAIDYENGLSIKNTPIFNLTGSWDIITFHHSFEHVPNPLSYMNKVYELLKPDGICIIRIPTVSSYAWKYYGVNWVQLDAPRHLFLHSYKSMELLGEKSKLKLIDCVYDSYHFQFTGSEKYLRNIPLRKAKNLGLTGFIKSKLQQKKYERKAQRLNKEGRGDQAAFFFKKPFN